MLLLISFSLMLTQKKTKMGPNTKCRQDWRFWQLKYYSPLGTFSVGSSWPLAVWASKQLNPSLTNNSVNGQYVQLLEPQLQAVTSN